jgi:hypothetical protein
MDWVQQRGKKKTGHFQRMRVSSRGTLSPCLKIRRPDQRPVSYTLPKLLIVVESRKYLPKSEAHLRVIFHQLLCFLGFLLCCYSRTSYIHHGQHGFIFQGPPRLPAAMPSRPKSRQRRGCGSGGLGSGLTIEVPTWPAYGLPCDLEYQKVVLSSPWSENLRRSCARRQAAIDGLLFEASKVVLIFLAF